MKNIVTAGKELRAFALSLPEAYEETPWGHLAFKVKKKAPSGTHELVFTGRDAEGRERTATVTMVIQ